MIDLSDIDHNQPFFHLSQKLGVKHEQVLNVVSQIDCGEREILNLCSCSGLDIDQVFPIIDVCCSDWRWDSVLAGEILL